MYFELVSNKTRQLRAMWQKKTVLKRHLIETHIICFASTNLNTEYETNILLILLQYIQDTGEEELSNLHF